MKGMVNDGYDGVVAFEAAATFRRVPGEISPRILARLTRRADP